MEPAKIASVDAAVTHYAPKYPRNNWVRNTLIGVTVLWMLALVGYGIPLLNRYTNVHHTQVVAAKNANYNHLVRMVAGPDQADDSTELGRLAGLVRQLRGPGYPNVAALRGYRVYPGEFPTAANQVGKPLTTQPNPRLNYGYFTDNFIGDVVEATPGQVNNLTLPTDHIRAWGNFRWRYAVLVSAGWWIGVGIGIGVSLQVRRRRKARARREFEESLTDDDYRVLELVTLILENEGKPGYERDLKKADELFALVRSQHAGSDVSPIRDIDQELEQLRSIYSDSK